MKDLLFYPERKKIVRIDKTGIYIGTTKLTDKLENELKAEIEAFNNSLLKTILIEKPKYQAMQNIFVDSSESKFAFDKGILWTTSLQENILNMVDDYTKHETITTSSENYNPYAI